MHGSTNNTFHKNGDPFGTTRTAAFDPGVLQAESIAQAAERGGLKVAQVEWAGGRNASIQGPTIDFQTFLSGRGVATNFIGQQGDALFDDAPFIASFGLQFDHPAGYAGQATRSRPPPRPRPPAGPACRRRTARRRRCGCGCSTATVDKYGLNAYLYDSRNDGRTKYDRVLFSPTKNGADAVGDLKQGEWADVKVTIDGGALAGKTAGMLVKVETLSPDLSRVRLFHTSVTRAIASWPTWPGEPGYTDFDEYLAAEFPTSTAADFAILEAGVTSEETYVQQGLYWSTGHWPMLEYVAETYQPDLLMVGMPTTDEFQHQFLGPGHAGACPTAPPTRRTTTWTSTASRTAGSKQRAALHPRGLPGVRPDAAPGALAGRQGPDHVRRLRPRLRAAVPGRSTPASRWSRWACCREPQTSNCRTGHRRDDRQGQGLLGRRRAAGLPQPRRARPGRRRPPAGARRPTRRRPSRRSRRSTSA